MLELEACPDLSRSPVPAAQPTCLPRAAPLLTGQWGPPAVGSHRSLGVTGLPDVYTHCWGARVGCMDPHVMKPASSPVPGSSVPIAGFCAPFEAESRSWEGREGIARLQEQHMSAPGSGGVG